MSKGCFRGPIHCRNAATRKRPLKTDQVSFYLPSAKGGIIFSEYWIWSIYLIVYNFSEIVASQASISKNNKEKNKHNYKSNYSMAAKIYHKFLKFSANTPPPDVIGWIQQFLGVEKTDERYFPHSLRSIGAVSFFYRVA